MDLIFDIVDMMKGSVGGGLLFGALSPELLFGFRTHFLSVLNMLYAVLYIYIWDRNDVNCVRGLNVDQHESLILAQNERWRQA